jgi:hypothetical protein
MFFRYPGHAASPAGYYSKAYQIANNTINTIYKNSIHILYRISLDL